MKKMKSVFQGKMVFSAPTKTEVSSRKSVAINQNNFQDDTMIAGVQTLKKLIELFNQTVQKRLEQKKSL